MRDLDFLDSIPIAQTFFYIASGKNYAAEIQKKMKVKPPSIFRCISVLEQEKFIKHEPEGRIIHYFPVWKEVASCWADFVGDIYLREAGAVNKISKGTWRVNEETRKHEKLSKEETDTKDEQAIIESISALKKNDKFPRFVEAYFKALEKVEFRGSLQDAFFLFGREMPIDKALQQVFKEKDFDFVEFLRPPRNLFLGLRVATRLRAEILEIEDDARI